MSQEDEGSLYTSIGIAIAISGNVLISLALNIQKVAHNQLHRARTSEHSSPNSLSRQPSDTIITIDDESRPLLPRSSSSSVNQYGATKPKKFWNLPKIAVLQKSHTIDDNAFLSPQAANGELDDDDELHEAQGTESDYLRSKLWYISLSFFQSSSTHTSQGGSVSV